MDAPAGKGRGSSSCRWVSVALLLAALTLPPIAVGKSGGDSDVVSVPPVFTLEASSGYTISGFVGGKPGEALFLLVARLRSSVLYVVPASASDDGAIQADLGSLGAIDIRFQPSGETRSQRSSCGGPPVRYAAGTYEGSIRFEGEEGYARAIASRAKAGVGLLLDSVCPGFGEGRPGPGATLSAVRRSAGDATSFDARKNGPRRRSYFSVSVHEERAGMGISRSVTAFAPPGAFAYDEKLAWARVEPPPPFSGRASFLRGARKPNRWLGDLSVDLPGRAAVPLAGRSFTPRLVRAGFSLDPL